MDGDVTNIGAGIITGVTSGVILALFFWAKAYVENYLARKDQIKFLSRLIEKFESLIFGVNDDIHVPHLQQTFPKDQARKAYFDDLKRQLDSALAGRSSRLTFDEIEELRVIFIGLHDLFPDFRPNKKWYSDTFQNARSVKWLKLTPNQLPKHVEEQIKNWPAVGTTRSSIAGAGRAYATLCSSATVIAVRRAARRAGSNAITSCGLRMAAIRGTKRTCKPCASIVTFKKPRARIGDR